LEDSGIDVWLHGNKGRPVDFSVSPEQYDEVVEALNKQGLKFIVKVKNLGQIIKEEHKENIIGEYLANPGFRTGYASLDSIFGYFAKYDTIVSWMNQVQSTYPSIAKVIPMGKSYESRTMSVLKISTGSGKPAVWIDGGIHAREWLAPSTVMYMAYKLVSGSKGATKSLLDKYDWYFMPVVNPDGYQYTHKAYNTRMWRKNRRPQSYCIGADLNRNFGFKWGVSGTSTNPCQDTFGGSYAFSEPETQVFRDYLTSIKSQVKIFLSLHAYSQMWFVPWAYSSSPPSDDYENTRVAKAAAYSVQRVNGKRYIVGTPAKILYAASGGSYDWAKGSLGVPYSYTIELRPDQNTWGNGFIVPPSEIRPTGEEIWAGVMTMATEARVGRV